MVDLPGFEPRMTVPKTEVLPLHHRSISNYDAKLRVFSQYAKNFIEKKLKKCYSFNSFHG